MCKMLEDCPPAAELEWVHPSPTRLPLARWQLTVAGVGRAAQARPAIPRGDLPVRVGPWRAAGHQRLLPGAEAPSGQ
jgi:hypothetical protein